MPVVIQFVVGLLAYMFPYEVLAKILVKIAERIAKATKFTNFDDEVVNILKQRLGMPVEEVSKDESDAS